MDKTTLNDFPHADLCLRVVHYLLSEADGRHLAHCLDLDLVAADASQEVALDKLSDLVKAHVELALMTGQLDNLGTRAPNGYWREFINGKAVETHPETIYIRIPESVRSVPEAISEVGVLAHRAT